MFGSPRVSYALRQLIRLLDWQENFHLNFDRNFLKREIRERIGEVGTAAVRKSNNRQEHQKQQQE